MSTDEQVTEQVSIEEPTEVGWYAYSGIAEGMIFHLRQSGQWSVHLDNGMAADCAWGYIEQALGVWNLAPLWEARKANP